MTQNWRDIYFSSTDDLKIYARHYPAQRETHAHPVLCLPGLTRNCQDFHNLASFLSAQPQIARDVYCIDYRGRGRSDYDRNWKNYHPLIELNDVLHLCVIEGIHQANVIGTSRGGIIAMIMAAVRPSVIKSVILNDIGPVVERDGLLRLRSYVGNMPIPKSWEEAGILIKHIAGQHFPKLTKQDFVAFARQLYFEADGRPLSSYDPEIGKTLQRIDFTQAFPTFWPQFKALGAFPVLTIRGALSDILSVDTLKKMQETLPTMKTMTVPDQGHAPLLNELTTQQKIWDFINHTGG